jgi:hypothetical protein
MERDRGPAYCAFYRGKHISDLTHALPLHRPRHANPRTNMRQQGVRSIQAGCEGGHKAIVDVWPLPGPIEVAALRKFASDAR